MYEQILFRYIRATSFAEMTIEPALRKFLTECGFRLPGEGQKVSRFVECFEKVYWADNSGTAQCPFTESSTVFLVGYAIIMLNSDHHRANVGKRSKAKMSKNAFIRNLSGTYSVILLFFLPSFLVCDGCLSLIHLLLPVYFLHSLTPHGTSLTIIAPSINQSINHQSTHPMLTLLTTTTMTLQVLMLMAT